MVKCFSILRAFGEALHFIPKPTRNSANVKLITLLLCGWLVPAGTALAQLMFERDRIYSPVVLANDAAAKRKTQIVEQAEALNRLPLGKDDETAHPLEVGLWGISQFMVRTPASDSGVARLVRNFDQLREGTQRALLEVVYGQYAGEFISDIRSIANRARHPRTFAMAALHVFRADPSASNRQWIRVAAQSVPAANDRQKLLMTSLLRHVDSWDQKPAPPSLLTLFAHQPVHGFKVIYSFQRHNRNYPGLAVVQQADGRFARDSTGNLRTFVQLARSASNLPWFLTNGSTPQGLFTITGTDVSRNPFIGPTPNLQTAMMYEVNPPVFTHYYPLLTNATPERLYRSYFPDDWHEWPGLIEALHAGRIGRSEIIAHGTTIDPSWFDGHSYYPISPTLGCLCAREIWNPQTGKIEQSDQLDLVNTFIETPGTKGYLIVINLDDKQKPVSAEEVAPVIAQFEARLKAGMIQAAGSSQ